jgi:hypothetical protein
MKPNNRWNQRGEGEGNSAKQRVGVEVPGVERDNDGGGDWRRERQRGDRTMGNLEFFNESQTTWGGDFGTYQQRFKSWTAVDIRSSNGSRWTASDRAHPITIFLVVQEVGFCAVRWLHAHICTPVLPPPTRRPPMLPYVAPRPWLHPGSTSPTKAGSYAATWLRIYGPP